MDFTKISSVIKTFYGTFQTYTKVESIAPSANLEVIKPSSSVLRKFLYAVIRLVFFKHISLLPVKCLLRKCSTFIYHSYNYAFCGMKEVLVLKVPLSSLLSQDDSTALSIFISSPLYLVRQVGAVINPTNFSDLQVEVYFKLWKTPGWTFPDEGLGRRHSGIQASSMS